MKESPRCLYPGDPYCSPFPAALAESTVQLVRSLYKHDCWMGCINVRILEGLKQIRSCLVSDSDLKRVDGREQTSDLTKLVARSSSEEEFSGARKVRLIMNLHTLKMLTFIAFVVFGVKQLFFLYNDVSIWFHLI